MKTHALIASLVLLACGPQALPLDPAGDVTTSPVTQNPQNPQVDPPVDPPVNPPVDPPVDPPVVTGFPCAVRDALQANCAGCHAGAVYIPGFEARADFLTVMGDGTTFGQRVLSRLDSSDQPMPPKGMPRQITSDERATISAWVATGMPAGECGPLTP